METETLEETDRDEHAFDKWWRNQSFNQASIEEIAYTAWLEALEWERKRTEDDKG